MYFIVGVVTGLSLISGLYAVIKNKKNIGIVQIIIAIVFPIILKIFCLEKYSRMYGDTDWNFLLQTAFIDNLIEPWLLLILFIVLVAMTGISIFNIFKNTKK